MQHLFLGSRLCADITIAVLLRWRPAGSITIVPYQYASTSCALGVISILPLYCKLGAKKAFMVGIMPGRDVERDWLAAERNMPNMLYTRHDTQCLF